MTGSWQPISPVKYAVGKLDFWARFIRPELMFLKTFHDGPEVDGIFNKGLALDWPKLQNGFISLFLALWSC